MEERKDVIWTFQFCWLFPINLISYAYHFSNPLFHSTGGADLTPYYLFDEDITSFHEKMKNLCDSHSCDGDIGEHIDYAKMKHACDDYFYLPARSEHRGVGTLITC